MKTRKILIANRGEVAIRVARTAAETGIATVAVYSEDDAQALHVRKAGAARALGGRGPAAYLDAARLIRIAHETGCDALHPGYGFLSENAGFARQCAAAGLLFIGPQPEVLELFGDKARARALAARLGVPLIPGSDGPVTLDEARAFMRTLPAGTPLMLKAVAGGGGRGMRIVTDENDLDEAYTRCAGEARAAFGSDALYAERLVERVRHIEVQVAGDGDDAVHLWERECTLQRRNQKLIEIAPSPSLSPAMRERICADALRLARAVGYRNIGTFEFLVHGDGESAEHWFIEANPRLQVEHTVTEEVLGVDLVKTQIRLAEGASLAQAGLRQALAPRGCAIQLRINMETMQADGGVLSSGGRLQVYTPPSGPGVRVDGCGHAGLAPSPAFDSLLAKLVVSAPGGHADALARARRALDEFEVEGVATNIAFLQALLREPAVQENRVHTRFIDEHAATLLAVDHKHASDAAPSPEAATGTMAITAPMHGVLVSLDVAPGAVVRRGQQVAVLEAMKMEHVVHAPFGGTVHATAAAPGEVLAQGQAILHLDHDHSDGDASEAEAGPDLDAIRPDLAEVLARHALLQDEARPDAVARRRKTGQRTARENIADLCDPDSFIEYGALALAAQRRRRSVEELIRISPADGLVAGIGSVNGAHFGDDRSRCMVISYDYTVFAGTQGMMNHKKTDRMFQVAGQARLPIVLFAEGGGGRPGDTDAMIVAGLDVPTFIGFARLSGLVQRIGIASGRCFAGNAALLGCCDVIIATENATIGMGGPAMIEGGGLGVFEPEEVGPVSMQAPNGVIDVVVKDEQEAVRVARQYLSYFQGPLPDWRCADQRMLRHLVPENRLRAYDVRRVIDTLADEDSVLELRREFGVGIITALVRIEGRPLGLIANNPLHLGGAIDADAADKAARFMQLCDAFDLPMLSLCDTPGFMVGPDAEKTAMVRHVSRLFVTAGSMDVPFFTVVLRKGYGLGAQAMAAGSFHAPLLTASWPSGEFGGMGLEGAVRLGYRKELEALTDPAERRALFDRLVGEYYEKGKAISMASFLEIDSVIDPMETRRWIMRGLRSVPPARERGDRKRPFIDTW
ncbi:MAG TPA: carboxyl transferase domain-containing protein [Noviherbaspirillum sp.]|nr:carboxyl transferase domain-containing protein [Noviherbaspirillum sp.]